MTNERSNEGGVDLSTKGIQYRDDFLSTVEGRSWGIVSLVIGIPV